MSTITLFILASRKEERYVSEFWKHLALARRQMQGVVWTNPLYVEDMISANAVVSVMPERYVVIGCMSNAFVAELLDQPAIREVIEGATRKIPFAIAPCQWDQPPCPFAGKQQVGRVPIASTSNKDEEFVYAVRRIRDTLTSMLQEAR